MTKIKISDIKSSDEIPFTLPCLMNFIKMYGLSWEVFSQEGYSAEDIIAACEGKDRRARLFRIYANRKTRMTTDDS